jgi:hypothetical protein
MSAKRSGWITGIVVLQFLYVLMLLALPAYLLILTRTSTVRNGVDASEEVNGLRIAALIVGGPALVALAAWIGLWKEKFWGWWLTVLSDLGLLVVFAYSLVDDGWNNIDWDVVVLVVIGVMLLVYLSWPGVRRFYWRRKSSTLPLTADLRG